jgi:hypothetical protein
MAKYTITSGSTFDLTDPAINPNAAEISTPRQGGFTVRNRIDFDNPTLQAAGADVAATLNVANLFYILEIPKRTNIRRLTFTSLPGEDVLAGSPTAASYGSVASATMGVGNKMYKNASGSFGTHDVDAYADHAITNSTGALPTTMVSKAASTPDTWAQTQSDLTAPLYPHAAPYGGYVTMGIVASTGGSSASSGGLKLTGVVEVTAECDYIPE